MLLAWHRRLFAQKNDGNKKRSLGRPRMATEIETWWCTSGMTTLPEVILTDAIEGILRGKRYLIHDRDSVFTKESLKVSSNSKQFAIFLERDTSVRGHVRRLAVLV